MEVISGIAAVSQLLGQAITLVQKIQDARAKVNGASSCLDSYRDQLDSLLKTLELVRDEPELQTLAIEEQIQVIISLEKEMESQLDIFAARMAKGRVRQYTHALISGDKDERELAKTMTELDRAKVDLSARITTVHVGLSGSMRTGFNAALAIIRRVDQNVQQVLGERLAIAAQLEGRGFSAGANGTVPLTDEDIRALNLVDKVSWINNEAFDDADLFNTDLVERQAHIPMERLYQGNKAHGRSTVVQGHADAEGLAAILRAKRGR